MMHEDEIKDLSSAMSQLGAVKSDVVERLCIDFVEHMGAAGNLIGSFESTERLLQKIATARACGANHGGNPRPSRTDDVGQAGQRARSGAGKLPKERISADRGSGAFQGAFRACRPRLTLLPEFFAMEVVMRMLRMESVQKDVLDGVERTLRSEFMSNLARSTRRDMHEMMADIFNNLDRQSESRFIASLEERNREVGRAHQGIDVHLRRLDHG